MLRELHEGSLSVGRRGHAAELVVFGEGSSGASIDLAGATELATRMVREFGLSSVLGPVGYSSGSPMYLGTEELQSGPFAEETQRLIDQEVSRLLREAEKHDMGLLEEHHEQLDALRRLFLEKETVNGTQVYRLLGLTAPATETSLVAAPHPATPPRRWPNCRRGKGARSGPRRGHLERAAISSEDWRATPGYPHSVTVAVGATKRGSWRDEMILTVDMTVASCLGDPLAVNKDAPVEQKHLGAMEGSR